MGVRSSAHLPTRAAGEASRTLVFGALALVSVAGFVLDLVDPGSRTYDAFYLVAVWGAGVAAWVATIRQPAGARLVPGLVAVGVALSAVGDLLWVVEEWRGHEPNLSLADVPYFGSYVALTAVLVVILVRFGGRGRDRGDIDALIDALTVVVVCVLVLWNLSIQAIASDSSVGAFVRVVWAAYPVADAVLLALVVRALAGRRSRSRVGMTLALGSVCWLVADLGFLLLDGTGAVASVLDLGWMWGVILMAAFAWRTPPTASEPGEESSAGLGKLGIAILPLLVPPGLALLDVARDRPTGEAESLVGTAILPLLVPPGLALLDVARGRPTSAVESLVGTAILLALAFARTARLLRSESTARAAARASHEHYEQLAANSSDAVIVVGADRRVREPSPQLLELVGLDADNVLDADWVQLLDAADPPAVEQAFARVLAEPDTVVTIEMQSGRRGGAPTWFAARVVNLLAYPHVRGVVVSLSDISARKRVEAELETARDEALAASQAKSAFVATVSHEIRTPMNGVIGLTGLLLTTPLGERQRQYAEGVRSAGETLLHLINDILDFSKIEAGRLELETIDFNVLRIVEEAAELVAEPAQRKGLELLTYCSPDLPLDLRGDPSRLRQVLLNLVSNAVKFTSSGEVIVRVQLVDRTSDRATVRFEVTDTGIGISAGDREYLFEPFSQADSSTTRRYGGTGLGLAIVRELVEAMGGEIGVDSTPDAGSTFWFAVPLELAQEPATPPNPLAGVLAGHRVLVVDDNHSHRTILSEHLTSWGLVCDVAEDAASALRLVAQSVVDRQPYSAALLDLGMPEVDGLGLAHRLSSEPLFADTGLVLLTSGASVVTPAQARDAGIVTRLTKPVHLLELRAALEEIVDSVRAKKRKVVHVAPERGSRGHVLVVEDSHTNQLVAVGILEQLGFSTEVAGNGHEAIAALARSDFAAILMDCRMPEMDGFEATAEIRRREGTSRHTPIIAMTAGVSGADRDRCFAAGMDDYVAKPVDPTEVDDTISRWVPTALA